MNNTVLHITLPAGMKTMTGALLSKPVTIDIASQLSPFYASIEQVKLLGGYVIRGLSDFTVAAQIYMASKEINLYSNVMFADPTSAQAVMFANARNQWVANRAASELILSLGDLAGNGSHVLANFSVTVGKSSNVEGTSGKLNQLAAMVQLFDPTVRSGGRIEPGGHARPLMAAKGVNDWNERSPGRLWSPYSAGNNASTLGAASYTDGRGKAVGFFAYPTYSSCITGIRSGTFQAGCSLVARPYNLLGGA